MFRGIFKGFNVVCFYMPTAIVFEDSVHFAHAAKTGEVFCGEDFDRDDVVKHIQKTRYIDDFAEELRTNLEDKDVCEECISSGKEWARG